MKRIAFVLLAGALVLAGCTQEPTELETTAHDGVITGKAKLHPEGQSGISGWIFFEDDSVAEELTYWGTASGMDPDADGRFVSLIYDNGSPPGGPIACDPTIFDPTDPGFILPTMFLGFWDVDGDGNGTLGPFVNTQPLPEFDQIAGYVPLDLFKTISIRDAALEFEVVACGVEATHPGGPNNGD